jgi:C-terminal processing protease CtpA/Prc
MQRSSNLPRTLRSPALYVLAATLMVGALPQVLCAQLQPRTISGKDRDRGFQILEIIQEGIEEYYYDRTFRGIDLKQRFRLAKERVKKASTNGEVFSIIAGLLTDFDDSHLYFIPPNRVSRVEYGWQIQLVGDRCFVVFVKPGSDAAQKGLKVGDEIWSIDGYAPTRENLWKIKYSYYTLKPRVAVILTVLDPDKREREMVTVSKFTSIKEFYDAKKKKEPDPSPFHVVSDELFIWKMRSFSISDGAIDEAMKRAMPFESMVLDLRDNSGGYEKALLRLLGYFFNHDVKLGDIQRRKRVRPLVAKPRGSDKFFRGKLIVLVDSNSASAAEMFARVVQLEKRGIVIGDRSSGMVMRSILHGESTFRGTYNFATYSFFAVSITDADITMADGKSLEHAGVAPDQVLLPTGSDLAAGRDPVLSRAAEILGVKINPQQAGTFFRPIEKPEDDDEDKNADDDPDKKKDGYSVNR